MISKVHALPDFNTLEHKSYFTKTCLVITRDRNHCKSPAKMGEIKAGKVESESQLSEIITYSKVLLVSAHRHGAK